MRSKPDPVDQPERTAHYDCAMCIAEMLHNIYIYYYAEAAITLYTNKLYTHTSRIKSN